MRIRTLLRLAATGAAGWAIGVSGVEDNPRFAVFLLIVAGICFLAAENYGRVKILRSRWGWKFLTAVVVLMFVGLGIGLYLAINYRAVESNAVDGEARSQAQQAQRDVSDLRTEVGALRGQVEAAIDFQRTAKEAQDAKDQAEAAERKRAADIETQRVRTIQAAIRGVEGLRSEWNGYLNKAARVCSKAEIGALPQELRDLTQRTREALSSTGYPEYVPDFMDGSNCTGGQLSGVCNARGSWNSDAISYFNTARCRISNLGKIIDGLRAKL